MAAATAKMNAYQLRAEEADAATGAAKQTMEVRRVLLQRSDRRVGLGVACLLLTHRNFVAVRGTVCPVQSCVCRLPWLQCIRRRSSSPWISRRLQICGHQQERVSLQQPGSATLQLLRWT